MSIKSAVGFSINIDAKKAGMQACQMAFDSLKKPDLVIVFASAKYKQKELMSSIRKISGKTPLVGCTTAGEISTDGPSSEGVVVMAIESDTVDFTVGSGGKVIKGASSAGATLAKDIIKKAKDKKINSMLVLTDVLTGNGADVVRGMQSVLGDDFVIIGGAAGDDFKFKKSSCYINDKIDPSSITGVGLSGKYSLGIGVHHGWMPIGVPMKVTKSSGSLLQKLDGKPAIKIYEEYFGKKADELRNEPLARLAITYPLGMTIEGSGELLIRDPISVNDDGSIICAAEIPVGAEIRLMIGSKESAIKAAKKAAQEALKQLKGKKPKAIFIFNCIARNKLFGTKAKEEIKEVQNILGKKVPLIGFYTYGEIAPIVSDINRKNIISRFHNETIVILAIGD